MTESILQGSSYLKKLGLHSEPFDNYTQDITFLYLDEETSETIALIQQYLEFSQQIVILSGARGIGKSAWLYYLQSLLEETNTCLMIDAKLQSDETIAEKVLYQLNQSVLGDAWDIFADMLSSMQNKGQSCLLLLDNVQQLNDDNLQKLFTLVAQDNSALHLVLSGLPQLNIRLHQTLYESWNELFYEVSIPAIAEKNVNSYIEYRLKKAGLVEENPFNKKSINDIAHKSKGVPAQINTLAHQYLLDQYVDIEDAVADVNWRKKHVDEQLTALEEQFPIAEHQVEEDDLPKEKQLFSLAMLENKYILGGIFVAALLSLILIFQDSINAFFIESKVEQAREKQINKELILLPLDKAVIEAAQVDEIPAITPTTQMPAASPYSLLHKKNETVEVIAGIIDEVVPVEDAINSDTEEAKAGYEDILVEEHTDTSITTYPRIEKIVPNPVIGSKKQQYIRLIGKNLDNIKKIRVQWEDNNKILSGKRIKIDSEKEIKLYLTTGKTPQQWQVSVIDDQGNESESQFFSVVAPAEQVENLITLETPVVASEKEKNVILQDANWIAQQNANHFTLQVFATTNKKELNSFIRKHRLLQEKTAFYTHQRNGSLWYSLIYGDFSTRQQAKNVLNSLPDKVKIAQPWIRRYKSIQKMLIDRGNTTHSSHLLTLKEKQKKHNVNQWVLMQKDNTYTIQLLASEQEKTMRQFLRQHQLQGKARYIYTQRQDKAWYIMLYGSYTSRKEATKAVQQLPSSLRSSSPWIRSMASIKKYVKR